jgi:putative oxidoreductase
MSAFIAFGRILFAVLFIVSGAGKLLDLPATTEMIASKITIPSVATPYTAQAESATGMTTPQLLAIIAGVTELTCGVLIALNIATAFFALILVVFIVVSTVYFHDFWNQSADAARLSLIEALKNLSLIGALFIIAGTGGRRRASPIVYQDV